LFSVVSQSVNSAEIYQYSNDQGRKIFVDRLSQVPAKYQNQLKSRASNGVENTAQQQAVYDKENKKYADSIALRSEILKLKRLKSAISTPVFIRGNQVIVPVDVKFQGRSRQLQLLLDTGASMTVVHSQSLGDFNKNSLKPALAQVAGGALVKTWLLNLSDLNFGPYQYSAKQVMLMEHAGVSHFDGLLVKDISAQTDYKIDFEKQRILWDEGEMSSIEERINVMKIELEQL